MSASARALDASSSCRTWHSCGQTCLERSRSYSPLSGGRFLMSPLRLWMEQSLNMLIQLGENNIAVLEAALDLAVHG